jgi:hypothetical protein
MAPKPPAQLRLAGQRALFDHLIRQLQQRPRDRESERRA